MSKYRDILETIRALLDPRYSHTRCPLCIHVVDVDPNGNMVEHGPGAEPCKGSGRNDEELADAMDREERLSSATRHNPTDGMATH